MLTKQQLILVSPFLFAIINYLFEEHDFILSGATAIEDKLQDGVADTIEILRKAGLVFFCFSDVFVFY
jgi:hypothetical protein